MDYFFDSSAIVKRYRQEQGSPWVRAICKRDSKSVVHLAALAQVEGVAALYRLARLYNLHVSWADATSNELLRHMRNEYHVIPLSVPVLDTATALSRQYWAPSPLRSLDAIQLACALVLRAQMPSLIFVTADGYGRDRAPGILPHHQPSPYINCPPPEAAAGSGIGRLRAKTFTSATSAH